MSKDFGGSRLNIYSSARLQVGLTICKLLQIIQRLKSIARVKGK